MSWRQLNRDIVDCQKCPRLRTHCQKMATQKRRSYQDQKYWGLPVPNLGPSRSKILIVGLAPAAHGANRTGRMFTGDRSGDWLFRAMYRFGLASQPTATSKRDKLKLIDCAITAVCHCAPPDNKPVAEEVTNCRVWLDETIRLCKPTVFLALGGLAWTETIRYLERTAGWAIKPRPKFGHCRQVPLEQGRFLLGSYHPSQQNTFTGRLTEPMFDNVFRQARKLAGLPAIRQSK